MSKELMLEAFEKMRTETKQAQRLTQQGELIQAEAIYLKMLEQEKNYPLALYGLSELADKIDEQEVREDLLSRAITEIRQTNDRNQKGVMAIWLTEQAEALMKLNRQNDAKACVAESEKVIKENLEA